MPFAEGTVIIDKNKSGQNTYKVLIQHNDSHLLTPLRLDGFSRITNDWVFIYNLDESLYRKDFSFETVNDVRDFFMYSKDEYVLTDPEFAVLYKCRERREFAEDSLLENVRLISAFAEMMKVNVGEITKKVVDIANNHKAYEREILDKLDEHKKTVDEGSEFLRNLGYN